MIEKEEIKKHLKQAFWDVNYNSDDLYAILTKEKEKVNAMTLERIYVRLLETYSWYKLLELVNIQQLEEMLDKKIINNIRAKTLKDRYNHVARILRTSTLSTARQGIENNQKVMTRQEKIEQLNYLCWDVPYNGEDLLGVLEDNPDRKTSLTKFNVYNKIIQGIRWYNVLELLNEKQLKEALQDEVLKAIFPKSYQQRYFNVKRLLQY